MTQMLLSISDLKLFILCLGRGLELPLQPCCSKPSGAETFADGNDERVYWKHKAGEVTENVDAFAGQQIDLMGTQMDGCTDA